jgi:hypothetical protein
MQLSKVARQSSQCLSHTFFASVRGTYRAATPAPAPLLAFITQRLSRESSSTFLSRGSSLCACPSFCSSNSLTKATITNTHAERRRRSAAATPLPPPPPSLPLCRLLVSALSSHTLIGDVRSLHSLELPAAPGIRCPPPQLHARLH